MGNFLDGGPFPLPLSPSICQSLAACQHEADTRLSISVPGNGHHLAFSEFAPNCVQERLDMREPATPSFLSCPVIHDN